MSNTFDKKKWKEFRFSLLQEGVHEDYEIYDTSTADDKSVAVLRKQFIEKIFPLIDKWSDDVEAIAESSDEPGHYYRLKKFIGELYKLLRIEKLDEMPKDEIPEGVITENKVDLYYNKIVADLRTISRNLSDDEVFDLHEKLKGFFNKLI